jgi:hypothetical protein
MKFHVLAAAVLCVVIGPVQAQDVGDGFLCCNMRSDGSWISDSNYAESGKTTIPAGTPVRFLGYGRNRVNVEIGGKKQSIGNDYSRDLAQDVFARRYIVKDDPKAKIAAMPAKIRTAVESSRITTGMTREQVLIALGYPISSETPHLDAPLWKYWLWTFSPFDVHFGSDGRVSRVETDPETRARVWLD